MKPLIGKRPAVFLDRDGVLIEKAPDGDYIRSSQEIRLLPGVAITLRQMAAAGFLLVVTTNQRGVALGLMSLAAIEEIHSHLAESLRADGAGCDGYYFCPHGHDDDCLCRKPKPGMLLKAAGDLGISLADSWMVGDSQSDIEAGKSVGCRTAWIQSRSTTALQVQPDLIGTNLTDVASQILQRQ
jgi:D-glycero-D-manno-heptose 1,7-bisphosphate phosphatase